MVPENKTTELQKTTMKRFIPSAIGISILSGAHRTLVPRVLQLLREAGLQDVGVLVGGIIPEGDTAKLLEMGVAHVFGPGTSLTEIVDFLRQPRGASHG